MYAVLSYLSYRPFILCVFLTLKDSTIDELDLELSRQRVYLFSLSSVKLKPRPSTKAPRGRTPTRSNFYNDRISA